MLAEEAVILEGKGVFPHRLEIDVDDIRNVQVFDRRQNEFVYRLIEIGDLVRILGRTVVAGPENVENSRTDAFNSLSFCLVAAHQILDNRTCHVERQRPRHLLPAGAELRISQGRGEQERQMFSWLSREPEISQAPRPSDNRFHGGGRPFGRARRSPR